MSIHEQHIKNHNISSLSGIPLAREVSPSEGYDFLLSSLSTVIYERARVRKCIRIHMNTTLYKKIELAGHFFLIRITVDRSRGLSFLMQLLLN